MRRKKRLLIVDDEPNIRRILQAAFERSGYQTDTADNGDQALEKLSANDYDLMLTDVLMPGMTGAELLLRARHVRPNLPVIVMTAYGTIGQAVQAMREGASDYITKPFDLEVVKKAVATWTVSSKTVSSAKKERPVSEYVFESPVMKEVMALVERIAPSRATVLLTGESGTGKEVIAKAIHRLSPRGANPFVAVSCAALPETLLESELFGHEKGAFTGADVQRCGRFEVANGGTLFLDEIGEIAPPVQVKLLRVLQEREIERLGSTKSIAVDVRLVAATNKDLHQAVAAGDFREDLYFRLHVMHLQLPPLRDRDEDILPLARLFGERFARVNNYEFAGLHVSFEAGLIAYDWPGNVRELENCMERAVILGGGTGTLTPDLLPAHMRTAA